MKRARTPAKNNILDHPYLQLPIKSNCPIKTPQNRAVHLIPNEPATIMLSRIGLLYTPDHHISCKDPTRSCIWLLMNIKQRQVYTKAVPNILSSCPHRKVACLQEHHSRLKYELQEDWAPGGAGDMDGHCRWSR